MSDLATELLDAVDDAVKAWQVALDDMLLRFELAMSVALNDALAPDEDECHLEAVE